jgi:hypothetical protein
VIALPGVQLEIGEKLELCHQGNGDGNKNYETH